jgi:hypothetical protein
MVFFLTQRIDDKYFYAFEFFDFGAVNRFDIGQVREIVDAVTKNL